MRGLSALSNIYDFTKDLGLIDKPPNIKETHKNMIYFVGLQNAIYEILKKPIDNHSKKLLLENLNIFSQSQINYVLKNQSKIIYPFNKVLENRKHVVVQDGGYGILDGLPRFNILSFDDLVDAIKKQLSSLYSPLSHSKIVKLLSKFGITPELVSILLNIKPDDIREIIGVTGFQLPQIPDIKITDWIFFPLWSIENLPVVGPFAGVPIDFMSIIIAQLDIVINALVDFIDNFREPAIQAATSALGVASAGVGLAAAPLVVPIINHFFDLVVHIVSHFATILNMFINISRKNFGLAYVLFCEIVPVFETIMNYIINIMVIVNRFLSRSGRFIDLYIVFLSNLERIIYLTHPQHIIQIKNDIMAKIQEKIDDIQHRLEQKIVSKIPKIE